MWLEHSCELRMTGSSVIEITVTAVECDENQEDEGNDKETDEFPHVVVVTSPV